LFDKGTKKIPNLGIGIGEIDVASPPPLGGAVVAGLNESGGLQIVNHYQLLIKLHLLQILLDVRQKSFLSMLGELIRSTLKRIVKSLGYFKKIVATGDHVPMGHPNALRGTAEAASKRDWVAFCH